MKEKVIKNGKIGELVGIIRGMPPKKYDKDFSEFDKKFKMCNHCDETPTIKEYILSQRSALIQEIKDWAKSPEGATGVDLKSRRWVELDDLLTHLNTLISN